MSESTRRRRRPQASTVIAGIAAFAALGGSATAASLVTGKDIKNGSITKKDVKKSSLTGKQVKNRSLGAKELSKKAVASLRGARGPRGAQGLPGRNGVGIPQVAALESKPLPSTTETEVISRSVPAGTYFVTAKTNLIAAGADIVECSLYAGASQLDNVQWTSTLNARTSVVLTGVSSASPANPLRLACNPDDTTGSAFSAKVVAVPVG